jgi:signal transduction histidine kinase/DNA-binding CsgD family transcriptional regulator
MDLATLSQLIDERERLTLALVLAGQPNKAIGRRLELSVRSVARIRASILAKTSSRSFIELSAVLAKPHGADAGEFREPTGESSEHRESTTTQIPIGMPAQVPQNDPRWRWLCCDLHDGVAQRLTGALKRLQEFENRLDVPREAETHVQVTRALLELALGDLREVIAGRSPEYEGKHTLDGSIKALVEELEATTGIRIDLRVELGSQKLTRPLETAVYRILQECLNNAIRHSGSKCIRAAVATEVRAVRIEVHDWGRGFDCQTINGGHLGLRSIWLRAEMLKGGVRIDSAPNEGTHIEVELPIGELCQNLMSV